MRRWFIWLESRPLKGGRPIRVLLERLLLAHRLRGQLLQALLLATITKLGGCCIGVLFLQKLWLHTSLPREFRKNARVSYLEGLVLKM